MACNRPIVSTKVGDSEWIFGNTEGCYLTDFVAKDVILKIENALSFSQQKEQTGGRNRIIELHLDAESISHRILDVYKKVSVHN
jgi:glycosyltransferase involved in cell wall biosynthesis